MSTIIYPAPIFGPVKSRRLGISLGINLMPHDGKSCTFDCIYCECGLNKDRKPLAKRPTRQEVAEQLEAQLRKMQDQNELPDVLTFAGNGEPTAHPDFPDIIDDTIALRNRYSPHSKISVLSNSTFIHREAVRNALMKVDNNILKLDTVDLDYIKLVDRPTGASFDIDKLVQQLKAFNGHVIIQTMFMKGRYNGKSVDNTGNEYVNPWLEAIREINPSRVMIYTIDRETPVQGLQKATHQELDSIAQRVKEAGFACQTSY